MSLECEKEWLTRRRDIVFILYQIFQPKWVNNEEEKKGVYFPFSCASQFCQNEYFSQEELLQSEEISKIEFMTRWGWQKRSCKNEDNSSLPYFDKEA